MEARLPLLISLNPRLKGMVSQLIRLRSNPDVERFLATLDYTPGTKEQILESESDVSRIELTRLTGWLDLAFQFGTSVREVLGADGDVVSERDGNEISLPIEPLSESDPTVYAEIEIEPEQALNVDLLLEFWEEETGGSEQLMVEMLIQHLLWCVNEVAEGGEILFTETALLVIPTEE